MNATFQELYKKYLKYKKPTLEIGSYQSLLKLKTKIEKYEAKQKKILLLSDMNLNWFSQFVKGLSNGKYGKCTNGTIKHYIILINGFLHQCTIFGYSVNKDYIKFREYAKSIKLPVYDKPILLDEELAELWKFDGFENKSGKFIPITPYKAKVRDLFILQCQVGLRWGDISRLKRQDLICKNGKWYIINFTTQKRKTKVSVQLNSLALKIVFRYCPKMESMPRNQPIFRNVADASNATHILKWIAAKCNLTRLILVKKGKLDKVIIAKKTMAALISTHMARSKFATNWILAGKDIYKLKIILGHSSVKTTERYIRTLPDWIPDGIDTELSEETARLFSL